MSRLNAFIPAIILLTLFSAAQTQALGTVFTDDFESDQGWTVNPNATDTATAGLWERAIPQETSENGPKQLSTTVSGTYDLVTGPIGGNVGDHDIDGGSTSIQSPSILLPAIGSGEDLLLNFSYYFAHSTNSTKSDYFRISVVSSGAGGSTTTTPIYDDQGAQGDVDAEWTARTINLDAFAGQTIQLLFEAGNTGVGEATLIEAAVDDVVIETVVATDYVFNDDFETDQGWTVNPNSTDTATTGLWERANPESTADSSVMMQLGGTISGIYNLVTGPIAGASVGTHDIDGGITSIRSPNIILPALSGTETLELSLSYYFAHNNTASVDDYLRVTVVGATSTVVYEEQGDATVDSGAWESITVSLGSYAGQTIYLLLEATDGGVGSISEAAIDNVRITKIGSSGGGGNTAPTVTITSPTILTYLEGDSISFSGTATDNEDGTITSGLQWSSDLDDVIGSGASFNTSNLSVGNHIITASVTDSGTLQSTATINIEITQPLNTAPVVSITAPADTSTYTTDDTITFTATAIDGEDDNASLIIQWSSSVDAAIGSGTPLSLDTLSLGTHVITASVTDSGNVTDTDTITVTVTVVPNTAPVANNDTAITIENTAITLDPRGNDTDDDSDPLIITAVTQGANGGVAFTSTDVTYTPTSGFTGSDSFTYTIDDGNGGSDTANVVITVNASGGGTGLGIIFTDDFESDQGWTVNPNATDTATLGLWERSDPLPTGSNGPKQLDDTVSGVYGLITGPQISGAGYGAYDIDGGVTSIRSPDITLPVLSPGRSLELSFSFYFSHYYNQSSSDDYLRITVVGTNSSTVVHEELGLNMDRDATWESRQLMLDSYAGQTIYLLIEAADEALGSLVDAGIDDVVIEVIETPEVVFSDDFETDQGWTVNPGSTDTATDGKWERGDPEPTQNYGLKQLGYTVSGAFGLITESQGGSYTDLDGGVTSVRSPDILLPNLLSGESLEAHFYYYLAHTTSATTDDYLRVSVIGVSGSTILYESIGAAVNRDGVWRRQVASLDAYAGEQIYLLIEAADEGSASLVEAGIDNVQIVKVGSSGGGGPSVPSTPGDINGPNNSTDGDIILSWGPATGTVTAYRLERNDNGAGWVEQYSGTNLSFPDSGLSNGSYSYRVQACNGALCSGYTASHNLTVDIPVAPGVPRSLSSPPNSADGDVTLTWMTPLLGAVTAYNLERNDNGAGWIEQYSGTNLSFPDSGLSNGSYSYRVQACNGTACSSFTAAHDVTVNIPVAPGAPGAISGSTNSSDGVVSLSWAAAAGDVGSYVLERSLDGGNVWNNAYIGLNLDFSETLFDGNFSYRVKACYYTVSLCSDYTSVHDVTVVISAAPTTPGSISGTTNSTDGNATLSWTASTGTVTAYRLERNDNGAGWIEQYSGTNLSFPDSGLSNGSYSYRVQACNGALCSGYTTTHDVTVDIPAAPTTPGPISGTTNSTDGNATLSWTASTGDVTAYKLERNDNGAGWIEQYSGTNLSFPDSGLSNGSYSYRVQACNGALCSGYTTTHDVTVDIPAAPSVPGAISGTTNSTDGNATLNWSAATGTVTAYRLERDDGTGWFEAYSGPNLSFSGSGLSNGSYSYRVQACNGALCSGYTASHDVTVDIPAAPATPGPISGTTNSTDGNATLNWSAATGTVTAYKLERDNGTGWSPAYTGSNLTFSDNGLVDGIYSYRIQACNGSLCSDYTANHVVTVVSTPKVIAVQHFQYDQLGHLNMYSADNESYVDYQYDFTGNRILVRDDSSSLDHDNDGQINSVDTDDDGDLMPDIWEVQNGFNPLNPGDANDDPDNDGLSNLQEYQGGSDPLVP